MHTVTISPKFQISIPKKYVKKLHLAVGARLHILIYQDRLELILMRDVKKMRGFLKGINFVLVHDKDRIEKN